MECHAVRGVARAASAQFRPNLHLCFNLKVSSAAADSVPASDRRLYHHYSVPSLPRSHRINLRGASPLSTIDRGFSPSPALQTRTIIISKVIEAFRDADITSIEGLSKFILESTPVTAVSSVYEWSQALTGLPGVANLVLCSTVLQLLLNTPAIIYMAKWTTRKEKHVGDMVAIKASLMRSPSREGFLNFARTNADLAKAYGCQNYKLYATIFYQVVCVTVSSFGVRSYLMNQSNGACVSLLPWGVFLGAHDTTFILPILNVVLNLLVAEVANWKQKHSDEGLKMTLRRASTPFKPRQLLILNLRRLTTVPLIVIYSVVPSGLALHWLVMASCSFNTQIILTHRETRRRLNIPTCYFETDKPFRSFLNHLRNDVEVLRKKSEKKV
ncbi:cytochrome c oxidase assembly protein COX18, mitochondrial-like isoform X2 [Thrips palmi]|uniref:Cytochrome c oxidase assembly protein COX18, mitochondrial-like isoform X2 n=1 Tax=Thrips palmi TaxID=161013 RepID=A0A6P8YXH8_THRPL|nr:cytochrome c oxidase assembly protein COX18, mitochondrial-like isoform X2 [Thrips palmi]XP_034244853.1 cytochrome c oxidase assembly protein COX18, mitochondrial-like isoform X2 [Thrips palmi]